MVENCIQWVFFVHFLAQNFQKNSFDPAKNLLLECLPTVHSGGVKGSPAPHLPLPCRSPSAPLCFCFFYFSWTNFADTFMDTIFGHFLWTLFVVTVCRHFLWTLFVDTCCGNFLWKLFVDIIFFPFLLPPPPPKKNIVTLDNKNN